MLWMQWCCAKDTTKGWGSMSGKRGCASVTPPVQGWSLHPAAALWGSAALIPYSPPTADSGLLWFVSREAKGDGGSCSILAEAKLFWLSLPQQNPSCICHTTERAVMTNLDSCNSSAYYEELQKKQRSTAARRVQASQRGARLILNKTKYLNKCNIETIKQTISKTEYMLIYTCISSCHTVPQHCTQSSSIFIDFIW